MKVLIVGGGGREHALAWKLAQDSPGVDLIAAPGNPGIAQLARCTAAADIAAWTALADAERPDVTIIGPEAPLAAGLADRLLERGLPVFGPSRAAARIETSKSWAKSLMLRAGIPTAHAARFTDAAAARRAARDLGAPVVIKATGLAAGKGVIVAPTLDTADRAIEAMLTEGAFGDAGAEILVEEFMEGEELSVFAITDGQTALPMLPAQDHKRLLDGDRGPNTGGMGAYAPVEIAGEELRDAITTRILEPTLAAMRDAGAPFAGLLYAGIMLTDDGPKVVEFNCRFGDPETQAILPLLESSLLDPLLTVARGDGLAGAGPLAWRDGAGVTTVVAAEGYPEAPRKGDRITLPSPADDAYLFHAGTARGDGGALVTAGGRVLAVTAVAGTFDEAQERSREMASRVEFRGRHYRSDIGWRESRRRAGAA